MFFRRFGAVEPMDPITVPSAQSQGDMRDSAQTPTPIPEVLKTKDVEERDSSTPSMDPLLGVAVPTRLVDSYRMRSPSPITQPAENDRSSRRKGGLQTPNRTGDQPDQFPIWIRAPEIGYEPANHPPKITSFPIDQSIFPANQQPQSNDSPSEKPSLKRNVHSHMLLVSAASFSRQSHTSFEHLTASTTVGASKTFTSSKQ